MTKGLSGSGFDLDLRYGKEREDALAYLLGGNIKIEVKADLQCRKTGNLFVEYAQRGRPSDIAVTQADYWAFEYDDNCWLIVPTERLKVLARRAYKEGRRAMGGDYNNYAGVLLPINWLVARRNG